MKLTLFHTLGFVVGLTQGQSPSFKFPGTITSLGPERLDIFLAGYDNSVWHKYHANSKAGWNDGFEAMNASVKQDSLPQVTKLGEDQLHIFINSGQGVEHKFWDGSQWQPSDNWETLGGDDIQGSPIATARGTDRLHLVAVTSESTFAHKYYDGTAWKPDDGKWEDLGNDGFGDETFESDPAVNSWGPDRLDIFGVLTNGTLLHKYWDGTQWQPSVKGWEQWGDGLLPSLTVTSWGESRLDVWAVRLTLLNVGTGVHRYWDGHALSDWEDIGGYMTEAPSVTHWSSNRIDILTGSFQNVFYKFWDGHQWNPSPDDNITWYDHTSKTFDTSTHPISATWAENFLNIFTVNTYNSLEWQFWEGSQWLPSVDGYYDLGEIPESSSSSAKQSIGTQDVKKGKDRSKGFVVQDGENLDL